MTNVVFPTDFSILLLDAGSRVQVGNRRVLPWPKFLMKHISCVRLQLSLNPTYSNLCVTPLTPLIQPGTMEEPPSTPCAQATTLRKALRTYSPVSDILPVKLPLRGRLASRCCRRGFYPRMVPGPATGLAAPKTALFTVRDPSVQLASCGCKKAPGSGNNRRSGLLRCYLVNKMQFPRAVEAPLEIFLLCLFLCF